jgi:predicted deacetylase
MSATRRLVVSVHDVTPASRPHVESTLELLTALGIDRRSLLVIPNVRGERPLDADEDFCAWLHRRRQDGDEIVLHGYEHVGVGRPRNSGERFRDRWFTKGEGEFLSLDYHAALDRIACGKAMMERAGLYPQGFVAPAWLINRDGLRAARDLGFQYSNSYLTVADLARERTHWVPSVVFGPGRLDEDLGVALQCRLAFLIARCPVVRVVLHPPCVEHRARFARVLSLLDAQRRVREPVTYLQLLEDLRRTTFADGRGRYVQ